MERDFFDIKDDLLLGLNLGRSNQEITMRTTVLNGKTRGTIEIGDISLRAEIDTEGNWNPIDGIKLKDYTLIAGSGSFDTTQRPNQMDFMHNDLTDIVRLDCVLETIEGALGQVIEP